MNKPSPNFQSYVAALRECVDLTNDSESNSGTKAATNNNKKCRQILINFDAL